MDNILFTVYQDSEDANKIYTASPSQYKKYSTRDGNKNEYFIVVNDDYLVKVQFEIIQKIKMSEDDNGETETGTE